MCDSLGREAYTECLINEAIYMEKQSRQMSYYEDQEDYYFHHVLPNFFKRQIAPPKGYWRTKEGVTMPIKEMTDSHLNNAIKMLERKGLHNQELTNEQIRRLKKCKA